MLLQIEFLQDMLRPLVSGNTPLWVIAIELALIGVPVYATLRFLRGTRGARLVRAVGLILVVSFLLVRLVAERLQLDRISYLYPFFVLIVSLIALVVFQPELRRGLMRIGEQGWFRSWTGTTPEVIEAILVASAALSKKKIGALIAIERTTSLGAVTETGVRLNAAVSAELIETIFWPGTALHDMGMIVQDGQIVAAGCQFPLADSEDVDRSLGSRHRAAVGLSQECDAVVLVVSEETGTISVAQRGRLRRSLTQESLRDLLLEVFQQKPAPRRQKKVKPAPTQSAARPRPATGGATGESSSPAVEAKRSA